MNSINVQLLQETTPHVAIRTFLQHHDIHAGVTLKQHTQWHRWYTHLVEVPNQHIAGSSEAGTPVARLCPPSDSGHSSTMLPVHLVPSLLQRLPGTLICHHASNVLATLRIGTQQVSLYLQWAKQTGDSNAEFVSPEQSSKPFCT